MSHFGGGVVVPPLPFLLFLPPLCAVEVLVVYSLALPTGRLGQLRGAGRDGRGDGCCQESQGEGSSERFHTCSSLGLSAEPKAPLAATSTTAPRPLHLSRRAIGRRKCVTKCWSAEFMGIL